MPPNLFRPHPRTVVRKIISGGQTGADRAALDTAIELGIAHGGWVPRGRWAEDGPLGARYQMQEADAEEPAVRTELNVREADATLIFSHGRLTGGSALTRRLARRYGKPVLTINLSRLREAEAVERVRHWLAEVQPAILNIAGPRASTDPKIYPRVRQVLKQVFMA